LARVAPAVLALVVFATVFSGDVFARGRASGPVHACASKRDGSVRIVGAKTKCKRNEVALSWARAGVPGARGATGAAGVPGPRGPSGLTGPKGANGPSGIAGTQIITGTPVQSGAGAGVGTVVTASASCPAGQTLLAGGGSATNTDTHPDRSVLTQSFPLNATTWLAVGVVSGENLSSGRRMTVQAWAICG
jgi:hypothetical protein